MLLKIIFALGPVGIVLVLSEALWRKKILKGERARKFIHILAGVWIAFWPFYIPFDGIFILSATILTMTLYSRFTHLFHAIYAVRRRTYGDVMYALALLACSYFGREPWIFCVSILLLALADGGAAVVGRFYGIANQYFVFGKKQLRKSIAGTMAFIILAYVSIGIGYVAGGDVTIGLNMFAVLVVLPLSATILENLSPYGLDNLLTPLAATLLLNSLL